MEVVIIAGISEFFGNTRDYGGDTDSLIDTGANTNGVALVFSQKKR